MIVAGIFGNVISSTVLRITPASKINRTETDIDKVCGINYCPWYELEGRNGDEIPQSTVSLKYDKPICFSSN